MSGSRSHDLVILIIIVALGSALFGGIGVRRAPPFTLCDLRGREYTFDGLGPAFINMTCVDCPQCKERVPQDRIVSVQARGFGLRVLNILVYADLRSGPRFIEETRPVADLFVVDPRAHVAKKAYRCKDEACWVLVDRQGVIRFQGADPERLVACMPTL
ncbi:MAG: hypothetical protein FJX76_20870 [Armatimonadetes bacterium]|nr:hypothetical protein [Armatimonadota bacterium]